MKTYQRNNIIFRIASADALSKFKAAQAHSFLQLTRKELKFDDAAKEAVLLEFDRFSFWLMMAEKLCLAAGEGRTPDSLKQAILSSLFDELVFIERIMESHVSVFSPDVISFNKMIHRYSINMVEEQVLASTNGNIDSAFVSIVGIISSYLQHLLISYHEFNNNLRKKNQYQFISLDTFSANMQSEDAKLQPAIMRGSFFIEHGCNNHFILKDYSEAMVFDSVKTIFEKNNILLDEECTDEILT